MDLLCWALTVALQDRLPQGSSDTWPLVLRHVENKEVKRSQSMTEPRTTLVDLRRALSVRSDEDDPVMQCLKKAVSVAQAARSAMEAILDFTPSPNFSGYVDYKRLFLEEIVDCILQERGAR